MPIWIYYIFVFATIVNANKECEKNEDCIVEGSICTKNTCACPPNTILNSLNTKCLPASNGYGSLCEDNIQCSSSLKSGGICNNGSCSCSDGYHYLVGQCWKSSGLGEKCLINQNCFVSNDFEAAVCSEKKVCVCSPGYYQREYSSCRRESYSPGDSCGMRLDCKFNHSDCNMNRTCEIGSGVNLVTSELSSDEFRSTYREEFHLITLSAKVGDNCKSNRDCPKNAECDKANKCSCQLGFYTSDNSSCFPELGAKCEGDGDCLGKNTQCRNGTVCVCKQGFVTSYNGRYCDKMSRYMGWSCLRHEQCGFFGPRGLCVSKKCQCSDDSHYVEDVMYCWIRKSIGESCLTDKDCGSGDDASCQNGKCRCLQNSHPSSNNTDCRQDSLRVGEPCVENLDCMFKNSFCDTANKTCSCLKGYAITNGSCIAGVGAKCKSTTDCLTDGSTCINGTCTCAEGFIGSSDFSECLPYANGLNGQCSESVQCSKIKGFCENGFCSCLNGFHYSDDYCYISKRINESCSSSGNCSNIHHSRCLEGICKCNNGYHPIMNGTKCSSGVSSVFEHSTVFITILSSFILKVILDYMNLRSASEYKLN